MVFFETAVLAFSSSCSLYLYKQFLKYRQDTECLEKKVSFFQLKINNLQDRIDSQNEFLILCDNPYFKINIIQLTNWEAINKLIKSNVINNDDLNSILKIYNINVHNKLEKQITLPIFTSVINHIYEDYYIYWDEMN